MRRINRSLAFVFTLIYFATPSVCGPRQPFSLTIAAPTNPLKAGSELRLIITLTNTSSRTITFARSSNLTPEEGFRYQIYIRDANGHTAPPSSYARQLRSGTAMSDTIHNLSRALDPGESFTDQVTVTKFYDLTKAGKYTVSVARPLESWQNLGKGSVKSNTIVITVTN